MKLKPIREVNKTLPRIPKSRTTYLKCSAPREKLKETDDCGVVAVAVAGKVSYEMAHSVLNKLGRKHRKGTSTKLISAAFGSIGAKEIKVDMMKLRAKNRGVGLTPNNVVKLLSKYRTYIAYTCSHVLTIRNGKLEDWTEGKRHRITEVFEIKR